MGSVPLTSPSSQLWEGTAVTATAGALRGSGPLCLPSVVTWLEPLVAPRPAPACGQNSKLDWTPGLCLERVSSCVTLGKLLSLSEPECLHLQDGNKSTKLSE